MQDRRFFVWFGAFFLFTGCALLIEGALEHRELESFRNEWMRTDGVVVRKWIVAATRTGPAASEYRLQYQFTAASRTYSSIVEVDPEEWESYREGGPVAVLYPRPAPEKSRLPSEGGPPSGLGEMIAGLLAALFGGTLAGWHFQRIRESHGSLLPGIPILRTLRNSAVWALRLGAALLFIGIAESIPALQRLVIAMEPHETQYAALSAAVMLLGVPFFIAGLAGRSSDSFSLLEYKQAIRSGRGRDPEWRRRTRLLTGAALFTLGLAGIFFAFGPVWVKAGVIAAILYVCFKLVR